MNILFLRALQISKKLEQLILFRWLDANACISHRYLQILLLDSIKIVFVLFHDVDFVVVIVLQPVCDTHDDFDLTLGGEFQGI